MLCGVPLYFRRCVVPGTRAVYHIIHCLKSHRPRASERAKESVSGMTVDPVGGWAGAAQKDPRRAMRRAGGGPRAAVNPCHGTSCGYSGFVKGFTNPLHAAQDRRCQALPARSMRTDHRRLFPCNRAGSGRGPRGASLRSPSRCFLWAWADVTACLMVTAGSAAGCSGRHDRAASRPGRIDPAARG